MKKQMIFLPHQRTMTETEGTPTPPPLPVSEAQEQELELSRPYQESNPTFQPLFVA